MSTESTKLDLDAIEARANAATPGPLYASENYLIGGWWVQTEEDRCHERSHLDLIARQEDAIFHAAAREDVPALVARVRLLTECEQALRALLAEIADVIDYGGYELEDRAGRIRDAITYVANGDADGEATPDRIREYAEYLSGRRLEKPQPVDIRTSSPVDR